MEIDERLLKEIRHFRYAVWAVAAAVLLSAAATAYSFLHTPSWAETRQGPAADPASTSACAVEDFYRHASDLQARGKFKELIGLSDTRLKACPGDHYAWWFKAKGLAVEERWDDALEALKRTELLRPDWRRAYVEPLRESIEWNRYQKQGASPK
jgi:cytochrome c-type biogenesis protein CcmH/NrfG